MKDPSSKVLESIARGLDVEISDLLIRIASSSSPRRSSSPTPWLRKGGSQGRFAKCPSYAPTARRNSNTTRLNSSGFSMLGTWAVPFMTTICATGMPPRATGACAYLGPVQVAGDDERGDPHLSEPVHAGGLLPSGTTVFLTPGSMPGGCPACCRWRGPGSWPWC